jgi:hypothetical protein
MVAVVAHTHWDREWYAPFEAVRARLARTLDAVLTLLREDPGFRYFLLDGQTAAVDDYLGARPAAEPLLRELAGAGRLAIGPWYVLMDEFCVSGETVVRNLQLGLARAAEFGAPMPIGYLPDMFGHVAQMPQILRLAGLDHAVVWRGVPAAIKRTAFWWSAPDGSTVRAEYLPVGYANGAFLPHDPDALTRRLAAYEAEVGALLESDDTPLLWLNGGDHQAPQPWMPALLADANARQDHFVFEQTSLAAYLAEAPTDGLPAWTGELRSGARANLLMGVASNRVDIKQAAAEAERALERLAEPLAALWLPPGSWPGDLLDRAWRALIRNSAHDSICACSADEVGRAVLSRYDDARALAGEVVRDALEIASVATSSRGPVVLNPGSAARRGLAEVVLPGTDPVPGTQVLARADAAVEERVGTGADLARILGELSADGWLGRDEMVEAEVSAGGSGVVLTVQSDHTRRPGPALASVMAETWAQAGAQRDRPLRVRVERRASQRVLARVAVPGYGWASGPPGPLDVPEVRAGDGWVDNDLVRVEVDERTGTFSLNGLAGLDRLVDGGDEGDTYNYSPPDHDVLVDHPETVDVEPVEGGPLRGRLRVRRRYRWPAATSGGARHGSNPVDVLTDLEIHAGEGLVRVTTSFDNPCRDHRLRAVFPLPEPAGQTIAECAYATVTRGGAEGGRGERALATFPARRFVTAGRLTITQSGLLEYELVDAGTALALTLLRATGVLSRPAPAFRPNPAGPALAVDGPQLLGPHRMRYAVALDAADPWAVADQAWLPLIVVPGSGTGALAPCGSRLTVEGAQVAALRRHGEALELRVFNPSGGAARVRVDGHRGWLVDLRGTRLERWDGEFPLRPWGIATAHLDATSLDA